jgi:hypothetical integral membrane protein (TIGR02206 family)
MPLFGPSHVSVLLLTVLITVLFCGLARSRPKGPIPSFLAWILGGILVLSKLTTLYYAYSHNSLTWQNGLPMHLCDWACFTALIAFATRNQTAYELTYFWGLAGTLQAVLTPDLNFDFPDLRFITFFVSHCGIIVALVYLTLGLGFRPTGKSIIKVALWGQFYLATTGLVDWLFVANYGYLRAKPINPSLLDYFGPWPWYILTLEILAVVFYSFWYLPFVICDALQKKKSLPPANR